MSFSQTRASAQPSVNLPFAQQASPSQPHATGGDGGGGDLGYFHDDGGVLYELKVRELAASAVGVSAAATSRARMEGSMLCTAHHWSLRRQSWGPKCLTHDVSSSQSMPGWIAMLQAYHACIVEHARMNCCSGCSEAQSCRRQPHVQMHHCLGLSTRTSTLEWMSRSWCYRAAQSA